jgi:hypothetical protein
MGSPAIIPTITQRVRLFLTEQGAALRPWTGLQETYDELYALLRRRRDDPGFWQPLKGLLQEVVESAADSQRHEQRESAAAELLDSWQVDALVDELQDALPDSASGVSSARTDFTRTLSTAVLGGFLLLGLAATGCGDNGNGAGGTGGNIGSGGAIVASGGHTGTGGSGLGGAGGSGQGGAAHPDGAVDARTGGAGGGMSLGGAGGVLGGTGGLRYDAAADVGLGGAGGHSDGAIDLGLGGIDGAPLDTAGLDTGSVVDLGSIDAFAIDGGELACTQTVDSELDRAIGESTLASTQKNQLCQCFAALSATWTTSLTQLFATASPAEISSMLSGITSCCRSDGMHTIYGTNMSPSSNDLQRIKNGSGYMICMAPAYKGVSFPD